jgi:riboflavin kinase/FMN adenylyltransferase
MRVHFGTETLEPEWPDAVVCVGTFDGVHLGHQRLILTAVEQARALEVPCGLVTFDRHPSALLAPDRQPTMIATLEQNLERFAALGVAVAVVLAFDRSLSETPAEVFLNEFLRARMRAGAMVVGHDFAFGKGREGNPVWLAERIPTTVAEVVEIDGLRVSSTQVRRAIADGDVSRAARLLGRPFRFAGIVVGGQKLGRTLGYPTINLARSARQSIPADGVYAGIALTPMGRYSAAIGIGSRPAVGGGARTVEAYLLDYPGGSLYGQAVELDFLVRLREERDFSSLEALAEQMARDVEEVRARTAR